MRLDMRTKLNAKELAGSEHLNTVVLNDGSIENCSWRWHVFQILSDESMLQRLLGGTRKEVGDVGHICV